MELTNTLVRASCWAMIGFLAGCGGSPTAVDSKSTPAAAANGNLAFSASTYSATQSTGSVTITVNRTDGTSGAVTVAYATSNGTAIAGTNFTAQSGTLTWADGDASSKSISVPVSSTAFSGALTFKVVLSQPSGGATIGTVSTATVSVSASPIAGDPIAFSASTYSAAQSAGSVTITIDRTGGTSGAVTVNYATSNGTAVAGTNYTAQSGTLSWAAGDASSKTISVPLSSTAFTGTLTFNVALSQPTGGAIIGTVSTATVSISGSPAQNGTIAFSASTYS